jgi:hypothetical protein
MKAEKLYMKTFYEVRLASEALKFYVVEACFRIFKHHAQQLACIYQFF